MNRDSDPNNSSELRNPLEASDNDNPIIEIDPKDNSAEKKEGDWRRGFLIKTSLSFFFLHLILVAVSVIYFVDDKYFDKFFVNYSNAGNGYDIFALTLLVLIFALCSILSSVGRKMAIPGYLIIFFCVVYLSALAVRYTKKERFNTSEIVITVFPMFSCTSFGLVLNVLFKGKAKHGLDPGLGAGIATGLFVFILIIYIYVLNVYDPYMWILMLTTGGCGIFSFYINKDMELMVSKRAHAYQANDWFLGFVHLHTDLFFRFWYDLIRKDTSINVEENLKSDPTPLKKNIDRPSQPTVNITI